MVMATPYGIPLLPLIAFGLNIFFGRKLGRKAAWVSIATSLCATFLATPALMASARGEILRHSFSWLPLGAYHLPVGYLIDPLAATLLFVVTLVGTLIQIYAAGYMHGDPKFSRFFAYVSLFMSAMLTVVIADNLVLFFIAWEIMGLCSYLLIGFWSEKESAANAGRKAFLTTKIGDIGFFLGILTLFQIAGNFEFASLDTLFHQGFTHPLLPIAALLIFCGTIGKSAQFPLHVWLPDAMEGPTPVSALIHAATMVAAGVYLVARTYALFLAVPAVMLFVAILGTITACLGAFFALTANDIKKILAYSTISQLGYMVAALGMGGYTAGIFHLMTHAYFKALLFLAAGSVIHGTQQQDIRQLGGLLPKMKHTGWTFILASLAIAGIPPLSGFWSKDEILLAAYQTHPAFYIALLVCAFITAFYMFRLVFLTFFGKPRHAEVHAHESPAIMTGPLWLLAAGTVLLGLPASPWAGQWFQHFLPGPHAEGHEANTTIVFSSIVAGIGGILLAGLFYLARPSLPAIVAKVFKPLTRASEHKLWFDEIYTLALIRPFHALARRLYRWDALLIDGAVNGIGWLTLLSSRIQNLFDLYIVDSLVNIAGYGTQWISALARRIQTGFVQNYMLIVFISIIAFLCFELR